MTQPRPPEHHHDLVEDVSPAVVTPTLDMLRANLDTYRCAIDAEAAQSLLDALRLRTYTAELGTDDRDEQVIVTVYGVDLSIRRRDDGVFVHVDSTEMPDELRPLIGEFNNGGENVYADGHDGLGALS
jgi:hypothetical protein